MADGAIKAVGKAGGGVIVGLKEIAVGTADKVRMSRRALAVAVKADGGVIVLGAIRMPYNANSVRAAVSTAPKTKTPRDNPFSASYWSISL